MIDELKLKEICEKYEINYERLVGTNSNILNSGKYEDICKILDFLKDELSIVSKNIEKCPSILYFGVENVKANWNFLKEQNVTMSNVEGCLHVLSTEPKELKNTYNYILDNYGIRYLNARTSILSVQLSRIREIERKFIDLKPKNVLQAAISKYTIEEIEKMFEVCKKNKIEITGSVFRKSAVELKEIAEVCNK